MYTYIFVCVILYTENFYSIFERNYICDDPYSHPSCTQIIRMLASRLLSKIVIINQIMQTLHGREVRLIIN